MTGIIDQESIELRDIFQTYCLTLRGEPLKGCTVGHPAGGRLFLPVGIGTPLAVKALRAWLAEGPTCYGRHALDEVDPLLDLSEIRAWHRANA